MILHPNAFTLRLLAIILLSRPSIFNHILLQQHKCVFTLFRHCSRYRGGVYFLETTWLEEVSSSLLWRSIWALTFISLTPLLLNFWKCHAMLANRNSISVDAYSMVRWTLKGKRDRKTFTLQTEAGCDWWSNGGKDCLE